MSATDPWRLHGLGYDTQDRRANPSPGLELRVLRPSGSLVCIPLIRDDLLVLIESAAKALRRMEAS